MCMGVGAMTAPLSAEAAAREKVILDADMVDLFDDGIAMMMLAESPKMDLKGVTIVIGNTWVETGTASAIRQLEGIGRTDIPVYMGVNETVRKDRFANMKEENAFTAVAMTPIWALQAILSRHPGRLNTAKIIMMSLL